MNNVKIIRRNGNLELITKLMNSVARKYNCHVRYDKKRGAIQFSGEKRFQRHITEEMLGRPRRLDPPP